jgi:hypothetical protein
MSTQQSGSESLLTEVAAAKHLTLSVRTLQAWRCRGEGPPFVRAGRAIRYCLADLQAWIAAQREVPSPIRSNQPGLRRPGASPVRIR